MKKSKDITCSSVIFNWVTLYIVLWVLYFGFVGPFLVSYKDTFLSAIGGLLGVGLIVSTCVRVVNLIKRSFK